MKISEMTTGQTLDFLTVAAVELEPILSDEKIMSIPADLSPQKDETRAAYGLRVGQKIFVAVALFGGKYRQSLYRVLASALQCTEDEIDKRPIMENMKLIKELLQDEALIDFFPSLKRSARKESSDTSPNPGH